MWVSALLYTQTVIMKEIQILRVGIDGSTVSDVIYCFYNYQRR